MGEYRSPCAVGLAKQVDNSDSQKHKENLQSTAVASQALKLPENIAYEKQVQRNQRLAEDCKSLT